MRTYSKHIYNHPNRSLSKRQCIEETSKRDLAPVAAMSTSSPLRDSNLHLHHSRGTNDRPSTTSRFTDEHLARSSHGLATSSALRCVKAKKIRGSSPAASYSHQTKPASNRSSIEEPVDSSPPDPATLISQLSAKARKELNPDIVEPHSTQTYLLPGTTTLRSSQDRHITERAWNKRIPIDEPFESSLRDSVTTAPSLRLRKATRSLTYSTTQFPPSQDQHDEEDTNQNLSSTKAPRSSIQSYFKPIQRPSSPQPSQIALQSSDPIHPSTSTPPSSTAPPQLQVIPSCSKQSRERPPRRLTTRSSLTNLAIMDCSSVMTGRESVDIPTGLAMEECGPRRGSANLVNRLKCPADDGKPLMQLADLPSVAILPFYLPPAATSPKFTNGSFVSGGPGIPSGSAVPIYSTPAKPRKKSSKSAAPLYQAQLDLGQAYQKVCLKCQMPYNSALSTDREIHDKRCYSFDLPRLANEEIEFNRSFVSIRIEHGMNHKTMVVTCTSDSHLKNLALKILDFTYREMGGMVYSPQELWERIKEPRDPKGRHEACRFKVYICYINKAVAGLLVGERYVDNMVVQTDGIPPGEKFVVIDRIWVSNDHRWKGVARDMIDEMRKDFIPGIILAKRHLTTSQLTDSHGKGWARKYFAECWSHSPSPKPA